MAKLNRIRKSWFLKWTFYVLICLIGLFIINSLIDTYVKYEFVELNHKISESSKKRIEKVQNDNEYYYIIDSLIDLKEYHNAIKLSELRIKRYPKDKPDITRVIATIFYHKEDFDSAIIKYTEAISLMNSYVSAYVGRGWAYMKADSIDLAIKDFQFASEINWDFYWDLGFAQEEKGLLKEAIDSYNKYLEHYPENNECKSRRDSILKITNTGN